MILGVVFLLLRKIIEKKDFKSLSIPTLKKTTEQITQKSSNR